jgi:microcystin-dependent protein
MKRAELFACILVTLGAFTGSVQAQNYTCTSETSTQKCLTINPQKFWIVGEIRAFAFGGDAKSLIVSELHQNGWLECEGQSLDPVEFPDLNRAIGTTWGAGNPKLSFFVPDLRGMFLRGWNHAGSQTNPDGTPRPPQFPDPGDHRLQPRTKADVGQSGIQGNNGDAVGSMQQSEFGRHNHTLDPWKAASVFANPGGNNPYITTAVPTGDTVRTTTTDGTETRPNNAYVMYFIYVGPYDLRNLDARAGKLMKVPY